MQRVRMLQPKIKYLAMKNEKIPLVLLVSYLFLCLGLSFNPTYRPAWVFENVTVWVALIPIIGMYLRGLKLSNTSYILIWTAMCLHTVGGYHTFSKVPLGEWLVYLGDGGRNNYDRLGHLFLGGFTYPLLELNDRFRLVNTRSVALGVCILIMLAVGALYEIWEWLAVCITEHNTGLTYVGAQGDEWDAQADMLCCLVGSVVVAILYWVRSCEEPEIL